jgi:uncharacterized repeat protein (TIGR02543 family)
MANGGGIDYSNGEYVKDLASEDGAVITLYAIWSAGYYYIEFDGNGGTTSTLMGMRLDYGKSYTLEANAFKRTGYTFSGWNTKKNGSGKSYKNKASVKNLTAEIGDTITLYAQWTLNKYTIKFDGNGSTSGSMSAMTGCKYSSSYTLTANAFKKTGYTFAGWNTKKDGSGKSYKNKASVKKLTAKNKGTVTLYAQWTKNKAKKTTTTCSTCNGKKTITCKKCGGKGYPKCSTCNGEGATVVKGQGKVTCTTCNGSGLSTKKCTTCKGKKKVTCTTCNGTGTVK